jgi:arylsulfatase A-like enzyme
LADETLLAVTSPRGYPLGEHRHVGGNALYGELLHVPLFVRLPRGRGSAIRLQGLVQPCDLHATLAEWLQLPAAAKGGLAQSLLPAAFGEVSAGRQLAVAKAEGERAVRSPAWLLRESQTAAGEARQELFAKPDDRWEANEVASHCGEVAEMLSAAADQFEQAAAGQLASLPPLAEVLCDTRR